MKHQLELENEEWLPIDGYEDLYQVSNFGRVKSLNYNRTNQERILKQDTTKDGYQRVHFCKDGKPKWFSVHRLVAMAFLPNPNNYAEINHIDEVKTNNHVDNLEWCNRKYNCNYGSWIEKHSGKFGKEHPNSKQVIQLTLDNQFIKKWDSIADVERKFGYKQGNISKCCKNKRKSANGYKWQYA